MRLFHEVRGCSLAVDIVAHELGLTVEIEWVDMTTKRLADGTAEEFQQKLVQEQQRWRRVVRDARIELQ